MEARCPSAKVVGPAVLYKWRRAFNVPAPHRSGATAGIVASSDGWVWGVVYALTPDDKQRLDSSESGGYQAQELNVKVKDEEDHYVWVYVPDRVVDGLEPDIEYVKIMLEGAREHSLPDLEEELSALIRQAETG